MCDEFERLDAERQANGNTEKIVYDCIDFPNQKIEGDTTPYIDEADQIELPPEENSTDNRKFFPYGSGGQSLSFN